MKINKLVLNPNINNMEKYNMTTNMNQVTQNLINQMVTSNIQPTYGEGIKDEMITDMVLLTPYQVSKIIGVEIGTLADWRSRNKKRNGKSLKFLKIYGVIRYYKQDVIDFIAGNHYIHNSQKVIRNKEGLNNNG